jgi:hypothetical protein
MSRHITAIAAGLLIVSCVLVFMPSGYVCAGGLVLNPGFELGEGRDPYGWDVGGNAARVATGTIYAGAWAASLTGEGDTLTQWIENITPLITYEAWGWIYVSGGVRGFIYLDFWEGKGGRQLVPTTVLSADETDGYYVQRISTMQAPVGATHLRIRVLGMDWSEGGEVRFDDVGFYPKRICVIATAAYGTETSSQLDILRDFRDEVLLHHALGSAFIGAYYRVGPIVADFIAPDDFLRAVVREMLINPMVYLLRQSESLWRTAADTP